RRNSPGPVAAQTLTGARPKTGLRSQSHPGMARHNLLSVRAGFTAQTRTSRLWLINPGRCGRLALALASCTVLSRVAGWHSVRLQPPRLRRTALVVQSPLETLSRFLPAAQLIAAWRGWSALAI